MKRLPVYIILIITVSFVTGCGLFGSRNSIGQTHFPLTPGSTWTYVAYDSTISTLKQDTIQVNILQSDTTSGQIQSLWEFKFTNHTDSITVVSSGGTLHFDFPQGLRVGPQGFVPTKIILPLQVGKKWTDDNSSSYSVVSKDTVSWSGGAFNESYQTVQKIRTNSTSGIITYWIEPNIGIVKAHFDEIFGTSPTGPVYWYTSTWTLMSYKID
ncbi:MAG TPA: hypothetical protein VKA08_15510 [Balneolales bacterium]|nr:hypothetical protein [Balneolales bacterium]